MAIPTKAQCTTIATQRATARVTNIETLLLSNAGNEFIGGTIPYGVIGASRRNTLKSDLEAQGWTVVLDDTNSVIVVS